MKKIFIVSLYILFSLAVTAQKDTCSFRVEGVVTDEHDGQPLENAEITIEELHKRTSSDSSGFFRFAHICKGNYTLVCRHPGCEPITQKVTVNGHTLVMFEPEHHAEQLKQVEIAYIQVYLPKAPGISAGVISSEVLERYKGHSLADVVKNTPGVVVLNTGPTIAKPVIHGMEGNRLLILNNFVPLEGQQWGSEHAPEADPISAGSVEVIRGASSLRYGMGGIGGVILMNNSPVSRMYKMGGQLFNGFSTNGRKIVTAAMLEGRFTKKQNWFARAQGAYTRAGNIRAPGYYISNTGINNYNFSGTGGYENGSTYFRASYSRLQNITGIFTGSHVSNVTDLLNAFNNSQQFSDTTEFTYSIDHPYQRVMHETGQIYLSQRLVRNTFLTANYARQFNHRQEYDAHGHEEGEEDKAALDMMATTHFGSVRIERSGKHTWESGVNAIVKRNTWEGRFLIPNYRSVQGGIYALAKGPLGHSARMDYTISARYDMYQMEAWLWQDTVLANPQFDFNGVSAQASLKYRFYNYTYASFNAGWGWRPPAVNELFSNGLHHGAAAYETGDRNLKKEQVFHVDAGVSKTDGKIIGSVMAYADYFTNYIYLQPDYTPVLTVQGAFPSFSFTQANALVTGVDVMLEYKTRHNISLLANAMLLWGYNADSSDFLPLMPANRFAYGCMYHFPVHKQKIQQPFVKITMQHVLKQNNMQRNGDYVPAPNAYALLNMEAGMKIKAKEQWITVSLEGNNLLNKKYRDYLNRFRYYADEAGINFTLRVSVPFAIIKPKKETPNDNYNKILD